MVKRVYHGWASLIMIGLIILIGVGAVYVHSKDYAIVYLGLTISGVILILVGFCSKCPCRQFCRHIILGPIASKIIESQEKPYTFLYILLTITGVAVIILCDKCIRG